MKRSGGILFDAKSLAHLDCKTAHESGISVVDEGTGKSHVFEDMFQVEFGDSFCRYCLVARDKYNSFGSIVVCNCEYRIITI